MSNIVPFPLAEDNQHVKNLAELLTKNGKGKDAQDVAEVFNCICGMENDLKKAMKEISALRSELSVMRDEQNHPIKTMLHKAADSLMSQLRAAYKQIVALKDKFIGGCKQAVEDIKDKGIVAANDIVGALDIKGDIESSRARACKIVAFNEKKVANIEAAATQFHSAGRAVKNIGLALIGKEPVPDIKPNGKLAKLLQSPFRLEIRCAKHSIANSDKALAHLDKLEKAAELRIARDKPSVLDEMKQHKEAVVQIPSAPKPIRAKVAGQEI